MQIITYSLYKWGNANKNVKLSMKTRSSTFCPWYKNNYKKGQQKKKYERYERKAKKLQFLLKIFAKNALKHTFDISKLLNLEYK